jgi:PAS domain S-box-containing protein
MADKSQRKVTTPLEIKVESGKGSATQAESQDILFPSLDFDSLLDCLPQGIRIIGKDHVIQRINTSFSDLTGIRSENAIGKKCWKVFPSPFCQTEDCRLKRIFQGEQIVQSEIMRTKRDGTIVPCVVTAFPLRSRGGEVLGVMESFRDITAQKELQARAEETEDRYRALIELGNEAGEAIVMLQDINGAEGTQTFVSDCWLRITGYSRDELLGTCFFDLVDTADRLSSVERHRLKLTGGSIPELFEMSIIRKDGNLLPIELTGACTKYLGQAANVLYIRDITGRKQIEKKIRGSEELYRGLFENVPIAIMEWDFSEVKLYYDELRANGVEDFRELFYTKAPDELLKCESRLRLTTINHQALQLWEVSDIEDLMAKMVQRHKQHLPGDEGPRECHIGLAEGKTYFDYEEFVPSMKGNWRYLHSWVSVAPGCEDTLSKVYVCFIDVTERKKAENDLRLYQETLQDTVNERTSQLTQLVERGQRMEEKLRELLNEENRLRRQLEEQIRYRTQFTRSVVHELKTPLTPLLGANEFLKDNLKEEPWAKLAKEAYKGALELNRRIDDLYDLTRDELGTLKLNYVRVAPMEIVQQLVAMVNLQCQSCVHELTVDVPETLPVVSCDPQRLKQVLYNLIDNACKHTQPGTKIKLSLRLENDKLIFQVEDSGPGIKIDKLKDIFSSYSKRDARGDHHGGLGLGLSICKTFVTLHGGEIFAESCPSAGSCFWFYIPLKPPNGVEV